MLARDPFLAAATVFTVLMAMALIGTEVHARRARAGMGMAGTQDIAMWGVIVSAVFAIGAIISLIGFGVRALAR